MYVTELLICSLFSLVRVDSSIGEFEGMKWSRGDKTFIFNGEDTAANFTMVVLDNDKKEFERKKLLRGVSATEHVALCILCVYTEHVALRILCLHCVYCVYTKHVALCVLCLHCVYCVYTEHVALRILCLH